MNSVYRRTLAAGLATLAAAVIASTLLPARAQAQTDPIVDARDALRRKDARRLQAIRDAVVSQRHPLAMWADYWEIQNRIGNATQPELSAFYERWPGTYAEDRLRNDWLLELGRRRDWANFTAELPRFRMSDDREVVCYALLIRQQAGEDVRQEAREAWLAQRDGDNGCAAMAQSLYDAGQFDAADAWHKARVATDINRPRAVRQALMLIGPDALGRYDQLSDNPARYLVRKASTSTRTEAELATLALERLAATDPEAAALQLDERWNARLPADLASWAWASAGRQAAIRLLPQAADYYQRAARGAEEKKWPDDSLAWKARAALRAARWQQAAQAINAMTPADQGDPTWVYWKARALQAIAGSSQEGEALQQEARELLGSIASQYHFYGQLAAEDLGRPQALPPRPVPLNETEKVAARGNPGLNRALQLIALGLRNEGVREWNWTLAHGSGSRMGDRDLLAAAQLACDQQVWDRCINTSDRTAGEFDFEQRFPMPFRREVVQRSREIGLDPAYVYGLIRQESRFIMDARSGVGASGLMQLMPTTARWTARKIGMAYSTDMITDRDTNIALGTGYLKLVLDDMGGSQALAAAAYNAGPGRPRRWREGPMLEAPIWVENIPFTETRDYVKKVLSNATYYAAILNGSEAKPATLKSRMGVAIGPRPVDAPPETDLP